MSTYIVDSLRLGAGEIALSGPQAIDSVSAASAAYRAIRAHIGTSTERCIRA